MHSALWDLYMQLQTTMAYGGTSASSSSSPAATAATLRAVLKNLTSKPLALIIGPGGTPAEVQAIRARLGGAFSLVVLTAHAPEIDTIRAACPDVAIFLGDIHDMPFPSGTFAYLFNSNVLEHCFAPYIALLECRRVLIAGGRTHFVLPTFAGREGGKGPFHLHCLDEAVWSELLRKTGLPVAEYTFEAGGEDTEGGAGYQHYHCVADAPPPPHNVLLDRLVAFKAGV
jgi:SAM-dependent methyltransferase